MDSKDPLCLSSRSQVFPRSSNTWPPILLVKTQRSCCSQVGKITMSCQKCFPVFFPLNKWKMQSVNFPWRRKSNLLYLCLDSLLKYLSHRLDPTPPTRCWIQPMRCPSFQWNDANVLTVRQSKSVLSSSSSSLPPHPHTVIISAAPRKQRQTEGIKKWSHD